MRTDIFFQITTVLVFLLAVSIEGLFFQYPKNVLTDFLQSLHQKKEKKKPPNNIHHYHLHYYPVQTQIVPKPVRAPDIIELDKLHNHQLEYLGWNDKEYVRVPEPEVHRHGPTLDSHYEPSLNRPWTWNDVSENFHQPLDQPSAPKAGILVQVPLHQSIIVQHPPVKEEKQSHPIFDFFQRIKRFKNSIFSRDDDASHTDHWESRSSTDDKTNAYVFYLPSENLKKTSIT